MIAPSRLLKSWAIPPASWPERFQPLGPAQSCSSAWRFASAWFRSVMSRATTEAPVTAPR